MNRVLGFLLIGVYLLMITCSLDPVAGGGSDLPDTKVVTGNVYHEDVPVANVQVVLMKSSYNPVKEGALPDSLIDTTDESGKFTFKVKDAGLYNLQANHIILGKKALITNVSVTGATTYTPFGILKDVGAVKVFLPDTIDRENGYIYVQGTTLQKSLAGAIQVVGGGYSIRMESVPAATITGIKYTKKSDPDLSIQLSDTIQVESNQTSVTEAFTYWAHYQRKNSGLPSNDVRDILIDTDGLLWFATSFGVATFDGTDWTVYNTLNSGLVYNDVLEIFQDNSGNIWFATWGGASKFDGSKWTSYTIFNSELPDEGVTGIDQDSQGNYWFATWGGIAKFDGNSAWEVFDSMTTAPNGLHSDTLTFLMIDRYDNVWFSSYDGAGKFDGTTWTVYDSLNSPVPLNQACRILIDRKDNVWLGHCVGMVTKFDGSSWSVYNSSHSHVFYYGHIYELMEDSGGNIWIGTQYGMTMYDQQSWHDFLGEKYPLLDNKTVYSIVIDKNNNTWVSTHLHGVIAFGPTVK